MIIFNLGASSTQERSLSLITTLHYSPHQNRRHNHRPHHTSRYWAHTCRCHTGSVLCQHIREVYGGHRDHMEGWEQTHPRTNRYLVSCRTVKHKNTLSELIEHTNINVIKTQCKIISCMLKKTKILLYCVYNAFTN